MEKKVIVAHFGKQHSYRLAEALRKRDLLHSYVTTVYLKDHNWTSKVKLLLTKENIKRVSTRRMNNVEDDLVHQFCEFGTLISLLLLRVDKSKNIYTIWTRFIAKRFARKLAKYVIKEQPKAIIMYDTNAKYTFEILEKKSPNIIRILDVSSASHAYMKNIYQKDMINNPEYSKMLKKETKYFWDQKSQARYNQEINLAHHFLVPSEYVADSIEYHKISKSKIHLCQYGCDINVSKQVLVKNHKPPLKCIYVGTLSQRKGIGYLLSAFENFDPNKVQLTLVGNYDNSLHNFDKYLEKYNFKGHVTRLEVEKLLSESDCMVFPSLSEGMSLSILEGLSHGLPIICTNNSGYLDIIKDGYNGFLIEIGDSFLITNKVEWCYRNMDKLSEMSKNALSTAKNYTWDKYEDKVIRIIKSIVKGNYNEN